MKDFLRKSISVTEEEIVMTFYKALVKYYIKSFAPFWTPFFKDWMYRKVIKMTRKIETLFYGRKLIEYILFGKVKPQSLFAF